MIYSLAPLGAEQVKQKTTVCRKKNFPDNSSSNRQNIIYSVEKARLACLLIFNALKESKP